MAHLASLSPLKLRLATSSRFSVQKNASATALSSRWPPSQPTGAPEGRKELADPAGQVLATPVAVHDRTSQAASGTKGCLDRLDDELIGHPAR
jgi:hypothetical protein